jgi:hypothetical protein
MFLKMKTPFLHYWNKKTVFIFCSVCDIYIYHKMLQNVKTVFLLAVR